MLKEWYEMLEVPFAGKYVKGFLKYFFHLSMYRILT